jgi:hypothetical protein
VAADTLAALIAAAKVSTDFNFIAPLAPPAPRSVINEGNVKLNRRRLRRASAMGETGHPHALGRGLQHQAPFAPFSSKR